MMGFGMGGIGMILFWIAIVAVIVLIVKGSFNSRNRNRNEDRRQESPLDVLKRRYAAGEISRDDFERKKRDIVRT